MIAWLRAWISLTVLKNHVHAVWNSAPLSLSLMSSGRWAPRQETIQSAEPLRLFPVNSYQLRKHNIYIWIWTIQLKSTQLLKWFLRLLSFIISSQHSISEKYVSLSCLELDCWRQETRRERESQEYKWSVKQMLESKYYYVTAFLRYLIYQYIMLLYRMNI